MFTLFSDFETDFKVNPRDLGMNMIQLENMDCNQVLTLVKAKEALMANAKYAEAVRGKKKIDMGCVMGIVGGQKFSNELRARLDYPVLEKICKKVGVDEDGIKNISDKFKAHYPEWKLDSFPGMLGNVTSGRVTNTFNLTGLNCVADSACASSLTAVRLAMDEIQFGNAESMLVGAVCTDNTKHMMMAFSKTPVFSKGDRVRAFSQDADGMLIGEGCVIMILKKLSAAKRDGDQIHALVRGVGAASDGTTSGIYTPAVVGQEDAVKNAYTRSGVDPKTVTLVEGHGTGTKHGDTIELSTLAQYFQDQGAAGEQIAVGSIKSQIGHLKAAAGFAGLLKAVLALKHKVLPRTINVTAPPEKLKLQKSPLYVNVQNRPWFKSFARGKNSCQIPRRAGVSAFGFGGTNWHCVLEEAESEHSVPYRMHSVPQVSCTDTCGTECTDT